MNELQAYVDSLPSMLLEEEKKKLVKQWKIDNKWGEEKPEPVGTGTVLKSEDITYGGEAVKEVIEAVKTEGDAAGAGVEPVKAEAPVDSTELALEDGSSELTIEDYQRPVDFNAIGKALGKDMPEVEKVKLTIDNLDQVSDYIEQLSKEDIKEVPQTLADRAAGAFLVNVPLQLESFWEGSKAAGIDFIKDVAGADAADFLVGKMSDNEKAWVDPDTGDNVSFAENPEKWKELNTRNMGTEEIEMIYAGTDDKVGQYAEEFIIEQFQKVVDLNSKQTTPGSLVKKFDINNIGGTEFTSGDELIGGIFNAVGSVIATAVPAALTRGASLFPQVVAPMYTDFNLEKARTLYGDGPDAIKQLVENKETNFITPVALGTLSMGLEYVGFKGLTKQLLGKTGKIAPLVSMFLTANKEGMTEVGQLGLETYNKAIASGKTPTEAMALAVESMGSKEAVENYLMGVIGTTAISAPSTASQTITKALISDTENFNKATGYIRQIADLQLKRSQSKDKGFREAMDINIEAAESSLKEFLQNTNKIAAALTKDQQAEILSILDTKEKNNNTLKDLNNSFKSGKITGQQYGSAKGAVVNKNKKLTNELNRIQADANKTIIDKEVEVVEKFAGKENTNVFETTKEFVEATGQDADVDAYIDPDGKIFINKQRAAEVGAVTAGSHELFHKILRQAFSDPDMATKLVLDFKSILSEKEKAVIQKRIDENYSGESSIIKDEEFLTSFSDAIGKGELKWSDNLTETFMRLAKPLLNIFRGKGYGKLEFESGRDVYDFIKDYQKNIKKGKISERAELVMATGENVVAKDIKASLSAKDSAAVNELYETKGDSALMDVVELMKPTAKGLAESYRNRPKYSEFKDQLTDDILTGRRGMMETVMSYPAYVKKQKAEGEKVAPLSGYINNSFSTEKGFKRYIEIADRILGKDEQSQFTQELNEEATSVVDEDASLETETVEPTKERESLRKKIELTPEVTQKVRDAVSKTFGTKLPDIDSREFKMALQKAFRTELKTTMAKDVMGSRAAYETFLRDNFETIFEVIPQSVMNKRFKAFVEPILDSSGKQKREKTPQGNPIFKKKTISPAEFIKYFLGYEVGGSTKGTRKDALAEALAEEFAFDATMETIQTKDVATKREFLDKGQTTEKVSKKIGRPSTMKFSKTKAVGEINIFLENQTFEKVADELAADNKQWKFIANAIGVDVISAKKPEDVAKMQEWVRDVLAPRISKSFFTNGTFANAGTSAAKRNFFFTSGFKTQDGSVGELGILLQDAIFGKDNENISRAVNRQTYVTGGQSGKISEKFIKKFNTKEFKKEQQQKLDGLKDIFKVFETLMKEDKSNASFIIALLGSTSQGMGHFVRTSAPVKFYAKDVSSGIVEEHTMPASLVAKYLFNSAYAGTLNKDFKGIENNYFQGALPFADDKKLKGTKPDGKPFNYTAMTPEGWKITDNIWARYFNINVGLTGGGIDPSNIVLSNGKTVYETYNITSTGVKVDAKAKFSRSKANDLDNNLVPNAIAYDKPVTTQTLINALAKTDKALNNARKIDPPIKKIRVFDFDDTLATSKSMVVVNMPDGTTKKINATQFAQQAASLEIEGAKFDFTEFSKVVKGRKGPLFSVAQKIADARGTEDVFILTARPQEAAGPIKAFMEANGIDIPLANITGLGDGTAEAKAGWIMGKAADGYNDFYFADDAVKNVKAVEEVLSQIDVKSKVQIAKFSKTKTFDTIVNDMIEDSSGIAAYKEYSAARAKTIGANKGKFNFFIPASAEDFTGLLYKMIGKGKKGDAQMAFLKTNLLDPYDRAESAVTQAKIAAANDFKALKSELKTLPTSLSVPTGIGGFTYSHAVRVAIWSAQGMDIPGLSKRDIKELNDFIQNDTELKTFANELIVIQKGKPYPKPGQNWLGGNITSDIINDINKVNRAEYQQEFRESVDIIFSEDNMNKMEAAYGSRWREAVEDSLRRMKSGSNRPPGGNRVTDQLLDWLNNSVGAVMFLNTRSALLQTISAVNFINWGDNNIVKAGLAFANQKQFWSDFMTLMNSDYLVERREGLKINVSESEIADAVRDSKNKPKAAIAFLLSKGFVMTRFADSFAIATGGSTFYRNRVKALVGKGMEQKAAEAQAFEDFRQIAEESQQSSNPNRISQQQASAAGRVVLAWANTPMQYARIQKRAGQDLINGRGDWKTNVSKIVYYGAIQNLIFNSLQQAVFALGFGEDDEDDDAKKNEKISRVANGMIDSQLKGLGIGGAAVVALKNTLMTLGEEHAKNRPEYEKAVADLLGFSPPLGSKVQKIKGGLRSFSWNMKDIKEQGFSLDNPAYLAGAQIVTGLTNIPLDRVAKKINNVRGMINEQSALWQRVALGLGWSTWDVGLGYYGGFDAAKVLTPEEEKVKEIDDMKKLTKTKEQVDMLLDLGLTKKEIKALGKEQARVEKIIELQNAEAKPKEEANVKEEIKEETKSEPKVEAKPKTESAERRLRRQFDSIKDENKPDQVKTLLKFGLSKKEIRDLQYEKNRVNKILELMNKNKK